MATSDGKAVWRSRRYVDIDAAMRHRDRRNARGLRSVVIERNAYHEWPWGEYYEVVNEEDWQCGKVWT